MHVSRGDVLASLYDKGETADGWKLASDQIGKKTGNKKFNLMHFLICFFVCLFCSYGEEMTPEDNINNIYHPLKHEAGILFTR